MRSSLRRRGPWLVWGLLALVAVWLYQDVRGFRSAVGIAEVLSVEIASLAPARVASLEVDLGQAVRRDQIVARLDTRLIDRQMEVARAEVLRLQRELEAQQLVLQREQLDRSRALTGDVERSALALARARAAQATTGADLESVEQELLRQQALVEQRLAPVDQLVAMSRRREMLTRQLEGRGHTTRMLEAQSTAALTRLQIWQRMEAAAGRKSSGSAAPATASAGLRALLAPASEAITVANRRLESLEVERASRVLRSPSDGRVSQVLLRPGGMAGPRAPVLKLIETSSSRIIAFLDENKAMTVQPGDRARLRPKDRVGPSRLGVVLSLAPEISELPVRLRPTPQRPLWGRRAVIQLTDAAQATAPLPGRTFEITFTSGPSAPNTLAPAAGAGAKRSKSKTQGGSAQKPRQAIAMVVPEPLQIPEALRAKTRIEPSGALWVPSLDRYLVVSDDTGQRDANDHAPWLMTLDRQGRFDPEPLPLEGIGSVNDLEAMAEGPNGIYLLASQSASSKGNRAAAREDLLRIEIGPGRRAAVTAQVPLLAALTKAAKHGDGDAWLAGLGLGARVPNMNRRGPDGSDLLLDLEGLAYANGSLLIGLKEPLSAEGEASLWRLNEPDRLLESGKLDPKNLELAARLPLTVKHQDIPLRSGISGLSPHPAGGFVLLSTIPHPQVDQVGAIWRLDDLEKVTPSVRLLRTLPGFKPEAITPGPDGIMTVLFDEGAGPPLWLRTRI